MPLYRDKVTGKVINFDHEPNEQELNERFGLSAPAAPAQAPAAAVPQAAAPAGPDHSMTRTLATEVGAPMAGFTLGGALGGKPGAVLGATARQAGGDLYNTIADYGQNTFGPLDFDTSKLGPNAPPSMMDELKRLAGQATGAAAGAYVLPAVTKAIPGPISLKNAGLGALTGTGVGSMVGHPGLGAAIGAGAGGYNAISGLLKGAGNLSEALTTPRFGGSPAALEGGLSAAEQAALAKQGYSPETMARVAGAAKGSPAPTPSAPQEEGPGFLSRAFSGLKDAASNAGDYLSDLFTAAPEAPTPPKSPLTRTKTVGDISERIGAGGMKSSLPDMSRNPEMSWSADVSAAPQRTPSLTQTSPTDPTMPWDELASRSNPKTTGTGGKKFGGVEISTPFDALKAAAPEAPSIAAPGPAPVGVHDEGLQRWIEGGGSPESYMKAMGRSNPNPGPAPQGPGPFGPNTVGAARGKYLPSGVNENKGMSLADQDAWASHKATTGANDSTLDDWFRQNQLGADPNEGLDIQGMIAKLTSLIGK